MGGSCEPLRNNKDILESWEFDNEIYYLNLDILFAKLKGSISITKENDKRGIEIKGVIKMHYRKQFYLNGIESSKSPKIDVNKIAFEINNKNDLKFEFDKDIVFTKIDRENAKINGEFKDGKNIVCLKLNLYLPKPKKESSKVIVNNFTYLLFKLTKPIDIISNSLCGLNNLINTCYINSSFQVLIHIPEFVKIILDNNDFEDNVIGNINSIFNRILEDHGQQNRVIDPSIFVINFKREHSDYNNHSQKDSEIFLEELIWNINSELSILDDKRITYYFDTTNEKGKLFYDYIIQSEEDTYYKINDLFYVCFIHEKKCEYCGYTTYYFDESVGLKLTFKNTKHKSKIDLYTLILDNFKNPIKIKSSFLCQNCNQCFNILETIRIAKLPKILILSLQKTNIENTMKTPWIVKFDKGFGIKEIVDINLCKQGNCSYDIFAINNHIGHSPRSGHYYSTIYLKELGSWFTFNDESVDPLYEDSPIPSLNNYILFYKQK